ncbi:hypothetical protein [Streptomyces chartreusis]|uniref:hypothetical protein n=1 Tax=Streptomyces chartreusis TaxID=1969 RepID=UPI0033A14757
MTPNQEYEMQRGFLVGAVGGVAAMAAVGGVVTHLLADKDVQYTRIDTWAPPSSWSPAGGTTARGVFGGYQLNEAAGATVDGAGALQLAVGAPAMLAAIGGSRPLLRRVTADPAQTAD